MFAITKVIDGKLIPAQVSQFRSESSAFDAAASLSDGIIHFVTVVQTRTKTPSWVAGWDNGPSDAWMTNKADAFTKSANIVKVFDNGKPFNYDFAIWRKNQIMVPWKIEASDAQPSAPAPAQPSADGLDSLKRDFGAMGSAIAKAIQEAKPSEAAVSEDKLRQMIEESVPQTVTIKRPDLPDFDAGVTHEKFTELLERVQILPNAFLVGPSGSGKTFAAAQVAESLTKDYATLSCSGGMSEGHLLGRLLPTGENGKFEYTESDFIRLYENGGVFLLDEIDAADPNVLIVINDAISGGRISVPNRTAKPFAERHKDFVLIAGANTTGNGRDRQYVGRNQLDKATLRRLKMNLIQWDYSPNVEKALCPDSELRSKWADLRKKIKDNGIRQVVDTQSLRDAYRFRQGLNWSVSDCVTQLTIDWSADEKSAAGLA